ncbi:hypothetical protein F2P81_026021 [Scophthalmus maximus]|uniref:Uncharacterized protein n=1 Tax=Scophthalmus maximus TaxID=52904 RepID=A0A6A4RGV2_SCOMX|nr:hypothetical protein F2P81_026021 [Scophthalmus maximus]
MESMLDVNPSPLEEDIDVTPSSPVAEYGSAECRRIRLEYERELENVKAERDKFCGEERMTEGGRSSAASEEAGPSSFSPWSSGSGRGNLMRQTSHHR